MADKSKKINVSLVISIQAATAVLISSLIIKIFGMGTLWGSLNNGDLIVGGLNFATMFCSNYSIKFVNYPFMVLAKSAKVLPVVLTGWLLSVYKLTAAQIMIAVMITIGLVIFNISKVNGIEDESLYGIALVLLSLLFDGLVGAQTDKNHQKQKRPFAYYSMLYTNTCLLFGNLVMFSYSHFFMQDTSLSRVLNDAALLRETILISLCGAFGQIFIYLTMSLYDNYKVAIITTTRKCLSVVASAFLFNHKFSQEQWIGASMVMIATCAEVYLGNKNKKVKPN